VRTGPNSGQLAQVADTFEKSDGRVCEITCENPRSPLADKVILPATVEHMIWVDGKGWTAAGELRSGDWLMTENGLRMRVVGTHVSPDPEIVRTLRLKYDSVFYANGILVQDLCGSPLRDQTPFRKGVAQ
jgi:hypothetical protein